MQKQDAHNQIAKLIEKIRHLNNVLSSDEEIYHVELDLLNAYYKELGACIQKLPETVGDVSEKAEETTNIEEKVPLTDSKEDAQVVSPEMEEEDSEEAFAEEPEPEKIEMKEVSEKTLTEEPEIKEEEHEVQEELVFETPEPEIEMPEETVDEDIEKKEEKNEPTPLEEEISEIDKVEAEVLSEEAEEATEDDTDFREKKTVEAESEVSVSAKKEEKPSLNERFMKSESSADLMRKYNRPSTKSLKEYFDLNERFTFSRELFDGNMEYFESALREISVSDNKEQAKSIIDTRLANRFQWDKSEKTVLKFVQTIEAFFDK